MSATSTHVGVLMGGPSAEREVSLTSGEAATRGLREAGYSVTPIEIEDRVLSIPDSVEAVFIALHGEFGEDGAIQQLLEERGLPYTGSGPAASRLAFDKISTKQAFLSAGIPTPGFEVLSAGGARAMALPVVVKPVLQGSSIGLHRVVEESEWDACFADARSYGDSVLVETFIDGTELTVGIIGDQVLPVLEIRAPDGHYDYTAKYTRGASEYLVPAPVPEDRAAEAQRLALAAYRALGCRGMGRIDFRMDPCGALYVLEVNTIPGFTETSLLPKAAKAAGIEFHELCRRIIESAEVG